MSRRQTDAYGKSRNAGAENDGPEHRSRGREGCGSDDDGRVRGPRSPRGPSTPRGEVEPSNGNLETSLETGRFPPIGASPNVEFPGAESPLQPRK